MYTTQAVNGVLAIQRDGQKVLSVCDQDWEFADWLCALLNQLGRMSDCCSSSMSRNDYGVFARELQHA